MPAPIPVELLPHSPLWAEIAREHAHALQIALGENLIEVHHIGSTSIPGLAAKPVIDLIPVVQSIEALDGAQKVLKGLGYQWWGENGLSGRRYCTLDGAETAKRQIQLHFFRKGSPEITRHLAFRDYLRARPEIARAYQAAKRRCQALHPTNSHEYSDCKKECIDVLETEALNANIQTGF